MKIMIVSLFYTLIAATSTVISNQFLNKKVDLGKSFLIRMVVIFCTLLIFNLLWEKF